jgi:hypothetical protein
MFLAVQRRRPEKVHGHHSWWLSMFASASCIVDGSRPRGLHSSKTLTQGFATTIPPEFSLLLRARNILHDVQQRRDCLRPYCREVAMTLHLTCPTRAKRCVSISTAPARSSELHTLPRCVDGSSSCRSGRSTVFDRLKPAFLQHVACRSSLRDTIDACVDIDGKHVVRRRHGI